MTSTGPRILISDDDLALVEALELILQRDGYEVNWTTSGQDVLDSITDPPDLYLIDIWLSHHDGVQICKQLKKIETTAQIPVVLMSAHQELAKLSNQAQADGFLQKPFEISELRLLLQQLLPPKNE